MHRPLPAPQSPIGKAQFQRPPRQSEPEEEEAFTASNFSRSDGRGALVIMAEPYTANAHQVCQVLPQTTALAHQDCLDV